MTRDAQALRTALTEATMIADAALPALGKRVLTIEEWARLTVMLQRARKYAERL